MADAEIAPARQEQIIAEIQARFDYASREWEDIRKEGRTDIRCVAGDPWGAKERQIREDAGRPCLSLDELGQYVNQLINEVRQHKRSIKVTPIGSAAKEPMARLRANLIRQIEYRSNAQIAYTTMFENAVQRSYGYLRVKPRYEHHRSFHQELIIEPFENPDMVTVDPDDLSPVGADMKFAFVHEWWNIADFKRRWPKAKVKGDDKSARRDAPKWWRGDRIQVAEYWTIEPKDRELLQLQMPEGPLVEVFADELEPPADDAHPEAKKRWLRKFGRTAMAYSRAQAAIINRREVEYPYVCQYMTNGTELLAPNPERPDQLKNPWLGTSIPIVACYGKVLWVDDGTGSVKQAGQVTTSEDGSGATRKILSLVRLARDPQMLYCYYRTCEAELVGMTPKTPFIGYEGQFRGHEAEWQKVNHEPLAYLEAKATTDGTGQQLLPLPMRQPYDPPIQPLEIGAESARRAIQAAMGIMPLPTQAQRQNEKSGVALERIKATSQQGSFHFVDHYEMAITRTGAILDELLSHYYDAARDVTVRTPSDETRNVLINDPEAIDEEAKGPLMLTDDGYDVTLSTGPNYESEREAATDFADSLVTNINALAPIIGQQPAAKLIALAIRLKNVGPLGDEMADMIAPTDEGKMNAQQLQQQLQQMGQMVEILSKELQAKTHIIETDQIKADNAVKLEELKANSKAQVDMLQMRADLTGQMRDLEVKLEIELAKIGSAQAMARGELEMQALHEHSAAELKREELATTDAQATMDRQAERDEAQAAREFEGSENARNRQAASELAEKKASQPSA